jgi:hypothetical protein
MEASDREDVVCRRDVIKNVKWRDAVINRHYEEASCGRGDARSSVV